MRKKQFKKDVSELKDVTASKNKGDVKSMRVGGSTRSSDRKPIYKRGPNDSSWRCGNGLATQLAASLPFYLPNGIPVPVTTSHKYVTPGIMVIRTLLTLGSAKDYNSPINLASRATYSETRKHNSGSKNYDAVDQSLYFGSMEQAYGLCGWLQRLYKTVCRFSPTDRFQPRTLISAMQVNYDDIKKHQAELAWLISWLGNALNSLAVPDLPIFHAAYEAYLNIYSDDTSPRKQIYLLDPFNFGIYEPTHTTAGGGINYRTANQESKADTYATTPANGLLYSDIYTMVHAVMDPLLGDEDVAIMSGDIMKAFDSNVFKVKATDMSPIEFIYSEEILQQIHNCRVLPTGKGILTGYEQDAGSSNAAPFLKTELALNTTSTQSWSNPMEFMIDAFSDNPSPEEVVNCTALQCRIKWHAQSGSAGTVALIDDVTFDLHLPVSVDLYLSALGGPTATHSISSEYSDLYALNVLAAVPSAVIRALNFDWAPFAFMADTAGGTAGTFIAVGDVRMINFFSFDVHYKLHENSTLSLFKLQSYFEK